MVTLPVEKQQPILSILFFFSVAYRSAEGLWVCWNSGERNMGEDGQGNKLWCDGWSVLVMKNLFASWSLLVAAMGWLCFGSEEEM